MLKGSTLKHSIDIFSVFILTTFVLLVILGFVWHADLMHAMTSERRLATGGIILILAFVWYLPYRDTRENRKVVYQYLKTHFFNQQRK